jgi:hypothetical protein
MREENQCVMRYPPVLVALLALIAIRIALVVFSANLAGDDGERYFQEARNLFDYGVFSHLAGVAPPPTAHDLPAFPSLMAVVLAITRSVVTTKYLVSFINVLFYAICAVITSQITLQLTDSLRAAFLTMLVMAGAPESVPYSIFFMPESLFLIVFVSTNYFALLYRQRGKKRYILLAFSLAGLCILIKPVALFYGFVLCCAVIWHARPQRKVASAIALCICGIALQALVVSPWLYRNQRAFGIAGLTSITGYNSFFFNYGSMLEEHLANPAETRRVLNSEVEQIHTNHPETRSNPMAESEFLKKFAIHQIENHPFTYAKTFAKRHPRLYVGTGSVALFYLLGVGNGDLSITKPNAAGVSAFLAVQIFSWAVLLTVYVFALWGLVKLAQRRNWFACAVVVANLMYFAVLVGPVTSTRYRLPMIPFFAIAAGAAITESLNSKASPQDLRCGADQISVTGR